jgi:4-hydroxymandelate oxidase
VTRVADQPSAFDVLVAQAAERLERSAFDFLDGGATDEITLDANRRAFERWCLLPRTCVDVSTVDVSVELRHARLDVPYFVAPSGAHRLFHPDAEFASAAAAKSSGAVYVTSTAASVSMEELAAVAPDERWYQLYCFRDRGVVADLVRRAEHSGYRALVVTVDAPVLGRRLRDVRNNFSVGPEIRWANLEPYGAADLGGPTDGSVVARYFADQIDPSITWDDIEQLVASTHLPVYVKGVLHPGDARRAVSAGVQGVYVSNHGGRQLDRVPATLDALGDIVEAVGDELDVLVDGGVRCAADVVIALARGADAVGLGRLVIYALAAGGQASMTAVLDELRDDLIHTLRLLGVPRLRSLDRSSLVPARPTES